MKALGNLISPWVLPSAFALSKSHIEWYGHFLFVLGLIILLKLRVAKWLTLLTLFLQTVLLVPYALQNQYVHLSMVNTSPMQVAKNVALMGMVLAYRR